MKTALRLGTGLAWLGVIALAHGYSGRPIRLLESVAAVVASVTQEALHGVGIGALRAGTVLYVPGGFSYDVTIGCTGLLPAAVLTVAILASRGTAAAKRRGLSMGVPLLLTLNLLRLVHLFWIGSYEPRYFEFAHVYAWEATLVLCTFVIWLVWSRWAVRPGQGVRLARVPRSWSRG